MVEVSKHIKTKKPFIIAFDSRPAKRLIRPEYKANRVTNPKVEFQKNLAYTYLSKLSENVHKIEGREADDLIAKSVKDNLANTDFNINIRTSDYDLTHNIDEHGRVVIMPANKNIAIVTKDNFEHIFSMAKCRAYFNSRAAMKVFFGKQSDNLPVFTHHKYEAYELYKSFCGVGVNKGWSPEDFKLKENMLEYIEMVSSAMTESELKDLKERVDVSYPTDVNRDLTYKFGAINTDVLSELISVTGCRSIARGLKIPYYEDMGNKHDELKQAYMDGHILSKSRYFEPSTVTTDLTNERGF